MRVLYCIVLHVCLYTHPCTLSLFSARAYAILESDLHQKVDPSSIERSTLRVRGKQGETILSGAEQKVHVQKS